jgi:hypothetical protein
MTNKEEYINHADFLCPLTKLVFAEPVVAEDGYIYEEMAINRWLDENSTSPTTGEDMGDTTINVIHFKKMVEKYLEAHPEMYEQKFLVKKPYYLFKNDFWTQLQAKNFNNLKDYTNIIINDYNDSYDDSSIYSEDEYDDSDTSTFFDSTTIVSYLAEHCIDNNILKYIIDNSLDYDMEDDDGYRPVHVLCKYSNSEIVKHLIEKDIDLESCDTVNGMRLMHYICQYRNFDSDLVKYVLDKGVDLYAVDKNGFQPLHYLVKYLYNTNSLQHFIDRGIDLEAETISGWKPLHIVCKYGSDTSYIKFVIDLNVKLDSILEDDHDLEGKTCDNLINENDCLSKKEKQEVLYYYLDKLFHQPDIKEDYLINCN